MNRQQKFRLTKLASLAIKTLSKPMSKQVKHYFTKSPIGQQFLTVLGQTTHNVTTRLTIWSAGYRVKKIQALEPEKALSQGAELVGEAFVFGVAGSLVVWEYDKSKQKEAKKDLGVQNQIVDVRNSLDGRLNEFEKQLDRLENSLAALSQNVNCNTEAKGQQQEHGDMKTRRRWWFW